MTGTPNVTITAAVAPPSADELIYAIETVEPILTAIATDTNTEALSPIRWVICQDFNAEVTAHLDSTGVAAYSSERIGGEVGAKTMGDPAHGGYAIYLNGPQLCDGDDVPNLACLLFLVAHEATHVLQYDTRRIAQASSDPGGRLVRRSARLLGRFAADEYRADAVAFGLLSQVACVTDNTTGDSRPAGPQDTFALDHLAGFEAAVLEMYPTLADTIDDYRNHRMSLDSLLNVIVPFTDQLVTLAAHWQAVCDTLDIQDPWSLGDLPTTPATDLYVRPLWTPLNGHLGSSLIVPTPDVIRDYDDDLIEISESAVVAFWEKLGLTVEDMPDGSEYIHIDEPVRVA